VHRAAGTVAELVEAEVGQDATRIGQERSDASDEFLFSPGVRTGCQRKVQQSRDACDAAVHRDGAGQSGTGGHSIGVGLKEPAGWAHGEAVLDRNGLRGCRSDEAQECQRTDCKMSKFHESSPIG